MRPIGNLTTIYSTLLSTSYRMVFTTNSQTFTNERNKSKYN